MDLVTALTLVVTGFVSCAEFGSYAFVHPVIRRLPPTQHIAVEQGLLRTFGRVMPVGMTLCLVLAITFASGTEQSGPWAWLAVGSFAASLLCTVALNVPINLATGTWDAENPPDDWKRTRDRWELAQALRSWMLLAGFVLICFAVAAG